MILIVDDEPTALMLMEMVLRKENFVARKATSGSEALRILGRHDERCDLIITDIRMPEMDGRELVGRLRSNPVLATIPVIMCTSTADRSTVVQMVGQGVRDYIVKPFNASSAISRVRAVLAAADPVIEPREDTIKRLMIEPDEYAPLAEAAGPALERLANDLTAALRGRDAKMVRTLAGLVKEPAEFFGAGRTLEAARRVKNAPSDLDTVQYAGILAAEIGELRSALERIADTVKA